MNIASYFQRSFERWPENPALWISGETHTYAKLHRLASSVGQTIEAMTPAEDDSHVAICAHKTLTAYVGVLGSLYAGRAYVPLNPRFPQDRNLGMIAFTGATCLVADQDFAEALPGMLRSTPPKLVLLPEHGALPGWCGELTQHRFLCAKDLLAATDGATPRAVDGEKGAYTLFTSGSTGAPKGVVVKHNNVAAYLKNIAQTLEITPADRCTQHFDLTFDVSVHDLFANWRAGACLYVIPTNAILLGARFVAENEISIWYSVPSSAALIHHHGFLKPASMPSLKYSLFCGEALTVALASAWQEAAPRSTLHNLYGPTEATITITAAQFQPSRPYESAYVPIGFPYADHRVAIVDSDLLEVPKGEPGELCISGPQVTAGYWKEEAMTAAKFVRLPREPAGELWYRTGDLVHWRDETGLEFRGRADRQIKLRGFRVELGEIEGAIRKCAGTDRAAVVGVRSEKTKSIIATVAFVVGAGKSEAEILAACRALMPDYMVPEKVIFLEDLPLNPNGKTDYRQLEARLART